MRKTGSIGYVLNSFPVVSETFILNEIRAMEASGVPLVILPLSDRRDHVEHAAVQELTSTRIYPPAGRWHRSLAVLSDHAALALRRPRAYFHTLWRECARRSVWSSPRSVRKRLRRFLLAGWIAERARRAGVVHLHAHYAKEPLSVADLVRRLTDVPYSFAAHAKDLYTAPRRALTRCMRRARFAVTCHADGERYLKECAGPEHEDKVIRVLHGVDTRIFHSPAGQREQDLILAVGRLTPKKGFDDLIEACARLHRRGWKFKCVIVGEGRMRPVLLEAIAAAGLRHKVRLVDFVPQEELAAWYARASVVAVPSRVMDGGNRDGIPNVLVEGMSCGAAIVACRTGGIPEVVTHDVTGLVLAPGDPEALSEALARLLERPEAARRLGNAGAAMMRDHDFRRTVQPLVRRFQLIAVPAAITEWPAAEPQLEQGSFDPVR